MCGLLATLLVFHTRKKNTRKFGRTQYGQKHLSIRQLGAKILTFLKETSRVTNLAKDIQYKQSSDFKVNKQANKKKERRRTENKNKAKWKFGTWKNLYIYSTDVDTNKSHRRWLIKSLKISLSMLFTHFSVKDSIFSRYSTCLKISEMFRYLMIFHYTCNWSPKKFLVSSWGFHLPVLC